MDIRAHFPAVPASVPVARAALDDLRDRVADETLRNARLLTTELATNVVRHVATGTVELSVRLSDGVLRIEVSDEGSGFGETEPPKDDDRASGWGLVLVQRAASRWGTTRGERFGVWFELPASSPAAATAPPEPVA